MVKVIGSGSGGGGADFAVEESHFAEEVARFEGGQVDLSAVSLLKDLDSARLDHVHAIANLALSNNDLPGFVYFS
ncbi:hypothetical protein LCGC14_0834630 [marine sediment metagenome]|uniref:Uncharacterized protein n=1 Tax=marine sediment metagenome TaxID=412755 RepID=A0A0F9PEZ0_9ZZZZ